MNEDANEEFWEQLIESEDDLRTKIKALVQNHLRKFPNADHDLMLTRLNENLGNFHWFSLNN